MNSIGSCIAYRTGPYRMFKELITGRISTDKDGYESKTIELDGQLIKITLYETVMQCSVDRINSDGNWQRFTLGLMPYDHKHATHGRCICSVELVDAANNRQTATKTFAYRFSEFKNMLPYFFSEQFLPPRFQSLQSLEERKKRIEAMSIIKTPAQ